MFTYLPFRFVFPDQRYFRHKTRIGPGPRKLSVPIEKNQKSDNDRFGLKDKSIYKENKWQGIGPLIKNH